MTATEVCSILEASSRLHVRVLKFGDLQVEFAPLAPEPTPAPLPLEGGATPGAALPVAQHEAQDTEALLQEELRLREQQVDELILTDPLAAEELIRDGDAEERDDPEEEN